MTNNYFSIAKKFLVIGIVVMVSFSLMTAVYGFSIPSINGSSSVHVGSRITLTVKNKIGTVKWSTSNSYVATVTSGGVVTGKVAGTVKVYAKMGSVTVTKTITVTGHSYGTNYISTSSGHYKTCNRCGAKSSTIAHTYSSGVCKYCKYIKPYTVTYKVSSITKEVGDSVGLYELLNWSSIPNVASERAKYTLVGVSGYTSKNSDDVGVIDCIKATSSNVVIQIRYNGKVVKSIKLKINGCTSSKPYSAHKLTDGYKNMDNGTHKIVQKCKICNVEYVKQSGIKHTFNSSGKCACGAKKQSVTLNRTSVTFTYGQKATVIYKISGDLKYSIDSSIKNYITVSDNNRGTITITGNKNLTNGAVSGKISLYYYEAKDTTHKYKIDLPSVITVKVNPKLTSIAKVGTAPTQIVVGQKVDFKKYVGTISPKGVVLSELEWSMSNGSGQSFTSGKYNVAGTGVFIGKKVSSGYVTVSLLGKADLNGKRIGITFKLKVVAPKINTLTTVKLSDKTCGLVQVMNLDNVSKDLYTLKLSNTSYSKYMEIIDNGRTIQLKKVTGTAKVYVNIYYNSIKIGTSRIIIK